MTSHTKRLSHLLILLCVSVPSFMTNLDANIVAVSLPAIAGSLKAEFSAMEWVISGYTLAFASLLMLSGGIADRYGRKKVLITGVGLFTVASFFCGDAKSVEALNVARVFQGVGAGMLLSSALAILSHEFRGAERARAFAFWGSVIGIAITLGPIAGGVITQLLGWQWAFYVNVPVGIAIMALTAAVVAESRDESAKALDIGGAVTMAAGLFFLTLALISGNRAGWTANEVVVEIAAGVLLIVAFVTIELRIKRPMFDLAFFRHPTYVGALVGNLAYAASLLTMLTYLPLFLQTGLGLTPLMAGAGMLPMAAPLFLVPRLVARHLTHRFSGRVLLFAGLILVAVGMLWIGLTARLLNYPLLLGGMLISGIGAGMLNGETAKVAMSVIPPERAGMGAGMASTVRFAGIVLGFAGLGAMLVARVHATVALLGPTLPDARQSEIARLIVAGDTSAAAQALGLRVNRILDCFSQGYESIFLVAAAISALAAFGSWKLVRESDTRPTAKNTVESPVTLVID